MTPRNPKTGVRRAVIFQELQEEAEKAYVTP